MPAFCYVILLTLQFCSCGFIRLQTVAAEEDVRATVAPSFAERPYVPGDASNTRPGKSVTRIMPLHGARMMSLIFKMCAIALCMYTGRKKPVCCFV